MKVGQRSRLTTMEGVMNATLDVQKTSKELPTSEKVPTPRRRAARVHPDLRAEPSVRPAALAHDASKPLDLLPATSVAPAPAPPPAGPRPAQEQAVAIEQAMMPSVFASALGLDRYFDAAGYRAFLDKVRADAGNPTDPVEVMLLEQLVLAHFRSAQLQAQAGTAEGLEAVKIYNSAAARLLSEFRLTALSLAAYRRTRSEG
jgi:hypothetical protein